MATRARKFEEFIDRLGLRHFEGSEFTPYWTKTRNGVKNSVPPDSLWTNIIPTMIILDELREQLNSSITLHSTYRSPAYNAAIEGEPASFHMKFRAIDFSCANGSPGDWANRLRSWRGHSFTLPGNAGQFIFHGGIGLYSTFVHLISKILQLGEANTPGEAR